LIDRFGSCLFALVGFQTVSFSFADRRWSLSVGCCSPLAFYFL
jgi:hypothetical protein